MTPRLRHRVCGIGAGRRRDRDAGNRMEKHSRGGYAAGVLFALRHRLALRPWKSRSTGAFQAEGTCPQARMLLTAALMVW